MAKIALRAYHHEVEGLIESNQSEEALAHCRYILQSFPKYLETYRLMGKFYLESQRYGEASDVFQRVLSSMPDDFVAHVGMSMIRQDEGNLDAAIWHMERAFESQPYNSAIQGELKRLYGRRDGLEPSKIRLTRGALARMYIKGGLHQQAIAELRAALAEDNKRPDLQVLLANAYFQADQRVEAVEASSSLIKKLPYCFEANRILACILPNTDRSKDAEIYRQRVVALDPYFVNLKLATPTSESVPDQAIVMDRLTWQTGDKAKAIDSSQPTWARDIGVSFKNEESLPDWLTEGGESEQSTSPFESEPSAPFSWDETPEETEAATPTKEEDIPDWMRQAGWGQSTGDFQEGPVDFDTPLADETPSADGLAPADMPDWLRGMAPADALAQGDDLPPREETMSWLEEPTSSPESPASDWLENLGNPPATPSGASASSTDMPDWLQGLAPEQPASTNASQPTIDAGDLDWLNGLDDSTPAASEPAAAADLPDWMQSLEPAQPSATSESAADNLDWLQGIEASTPAASEPAVAADLPDWMQSLEPAQPAATSEPAADNMDWLQGIEASTPAVNEEGNETAAADIPDWMQNLDTSEQSTPAADQPSAAPGITGMTDWLQSLEHEEAAPAQASNDIPDWLSEIQTSEEATPPEAPGLADTTPPAFTQPALTDEKPEMDWLQSLTADETTTSDEAPTDGMPDWLTALEPETPASTSPTESAQETGIPEWLLESEATALAPDTADSPETSETPDWLATGEESSGVTGFLTSLNVPSKEPQGMEQPASPNEADALVWLDGLMGEGGISEDSLFSGETTPAAGPAAPAATPSEEAIPDWLQATADEEPPAHEVAPAAAEAAPGELPAWLTEAAIEPVVEAEPVEAEPAQVPDWLSAIEAEADQFEAQQAAPSASIPEAAVEPEPELPQVEIPEVPATTPELSAEADAMAWLDGLMGEGGISEDALFSGETTPAASPAAPAATPSEGAIPNWLQATADEEPPADEVAPAAAEAAPGELPAWLTETAIEPVTEAEPVEAEPAQVPDWLSAIEAEADQFEAQQAAPSASIPEAAVEPEPELPQVEIPEVPATTPELSAEADAMAWLDGLMGEGGISEDALFSGETTPAGSPAAPAATPSEEAIPDWLQATADEEPPAHEVAPAAAEAAPGELPAWLTEAAIEPVVEAEPVEAEPAQVPDWLSAIEAEADQFEAQQAAPSGSIPEAAVEPEPELPQVEIPEVPSTTPELSAEANAMAWLDGLMGEGGISEDALFSGTTEEKAAEVAPATSPAEEAIASTPSEPIAATEPVESLTDEWLSTVEAEADQFDTQQAAAPAVEAVPTPPSPEATASIPDLSDEAAAMAWLEGLAAKQGVSEEELFTPVEKRTETPPAWVEADAEVALINNEPAIGEEPIQPAEMAEDEAAPVTASVAPFAEEPVIEEQPAETNIPAWLSAIEADADEFEMQTAALVEPEPPAIEVPDEPTEVYQEPIIQHASPDWLLSIQEESDEGEIAAEMVTQPEPAATPDWLNTVVEEPEELAPPAPTEPTPATVEEIPAWQQPTKTISRSGLAAAMARIEAAPEPPAPEEPETGLDVNTASLVQLEALPGIGFILAQNIINYRETYGAFTSLDDLQKVSGVGPTTINELRQWLRVVAPRTAERFANRATPLGGALEEARVHLAQNDPGKAAQIYGQLLRSGHSVSEIVGDLQNALYRYPVDIGLWQVLGEAYLLNDQLQEALEAYSKAEELLR